MKTKINFQIKNLYDCSFTSDQGVKNFIVAANSFGSAASIAHFVASNWVDYDSYQLTKIVICDIVVTD